MAPQEPQFTLVRTDIAGFAGFAERGPLPEDFSGRHFDATDVVTGKPIRRLLLAGHATTRWFVAYERGGRGHDLVLVIFDSGAKAPEPTLLARGTAGAHDDQAGWRVSLAELRAALKDGTLSQDDVHEPYY